MSPCTLVACRHINREECLFLDAARGCRVTPLTDRTRGSERRPRTIVRRGPEPRLSFKRLTNPMATRAVAKTPTGIPTSHSSNTLVTAAAVRRPKRVAPREARGARGKGNREEPRRSGGREPRSRGRLDYMDISTTRWGAGALEKKPKGRGRWVTPMGRGRIIFS